MVAINEDLVKSTKATSRDKANITNTAAAKIIDAETENRLKKTERLRAARLAAESIIPAPVPISPKKRKKSFKNKSLLSNR